MYIYMYIYIYIYIYIYVYVWGERRTFQHLPRKVVRLSVRSSPASRRGVGLQQVDRLRTL